MAIRNLKRHELLATITKVVKITGGTGTVHFETTDGDTGEVSVIAEGWDVIHPNEWPPQVGDQIKIIVQPAVMLRWRGRS